MVFDFPVAEAVVEVVVDHPGGLHVSVDHRGADEPEAPFFQVGGDQVGEVRPGWDHAQAGEPVNHRLVVCKRPDVMVETAELLLNAEETAGITDAGLNFQAVADDAGILQEPFHILLIEKGYPCRVKITEHLPEGLPFMQDGPPAQSRLETFQNQEFK